MSIKIKGSGSINLTRITPIILALFGGFELKSKIEYGSVKFKYNSSKHRGASCARSIIDALYECVITKGVEVNSIEPENYEEKLNLIGLNFKVADLVGFSEFVKNSHLNDELNYIEFDFDEMFELANYLDDGHGLSKVSYEAGGMADWGPFGCGTYITKNTHIKAYSTEPETLGCKIDSSKNIQEASEVIYEEVKSLLASIKDVQKRSDIRTILSEQLASLG